MIFLYQHGIGLQHRRFELHSVRRRRQPSRGCGWLRRRQRFFLPLDLSLAIDDLCLRRRLPAFCSVDSLRACASSFVCSICFCFQRQGVLHRIGVCLRLQKRALAACASAAFHVHAASSAPPLPAPAIFTCFLLDLLFPCQVARSPVPSARSPSSPLRIFRGKAAGSRKQYFPHDDSVHSPARAVTASAALVRNSSRLVAKISRVT